MRLKHSFPGFLIILSLLLAACGDSTATTATIITTTNPTIATTTTNPITAAPTTSLLAPTNTPAPATFKLGLLWKLKSVPNYEFNSTRSVVIDTKGFISLMDTANNRVLKFDSDGKFIAAWGQSGSADGELGVGLGAAEDTPNGRMVIDRQDIIYIPDTNNHRIQKFDSNGKFLAKWEIQGAAENFRPLAIALDSKGDVWVGTLEFPKTGPARPIIGSIQHYDNTGKFLGEWFPSKVEGATFTNPTALAFDLEGNLLAGDDEGHLVRFSSDGKFLNQLDKAGVNLKFVTSIVVEDKSNLYVADNTAKIQLLDKNGKVLGKWEEPGFEQVYGLALDGKGNLYVADTMIGNEGTFYKFSLNVTTATGSTPTPASGVDAALTLRAATAVAQAKVPTIAQYVQVLPSPYNSGGALARDPQGNFYVPIQRSNYIVKIDQNGKQIGSIGKAGSGDGEINCVDDSLTFFTDCGVITDSQGNLYVADSQNHRIQKFDPNGKFISKWGTKGNGDGELFYPSRMAIDTNGNIYTVETGNERASKFDPNGKFLGKFGTPGTGEGQLTTVTAVALDSSGNVYIADYKLHKIVKYDPKGKFLMEVVNKANDDSKLDVISGIGVDVKGNIYASDTYRNIVQKFDPQGRYLGKIKEPPTPKVPFEGPGDMAFVGDTIYISLALGGIYEFKLT